MPKTAAAKSEESDSAAVLSVISNSAFVRREVAAQADAQTAARQALFDELAALDVDGAGERSHYEADIEKARAAIRAVEAKLRDAIGIAVEIQQRHDQARFSRDGRRSAIEGELKATANPIVNQFFSWLLDEQDRCCRTPIEALQIGEARNAVTGKRSSARVVTNHISIVARLTAVREALRQLDDLRLMPDQREIPARIVEIKESFPAIEPPKAPPVPKEAADE